MSIRRRSTILLAAITALAPLAEAGVERIVLLPDATVAGGVPVKAEVRLDEAANRDTMQPSIDSPAQVTIPAGERRSTFEVTAQSLPAGAVYCRVVFEATWSGDTVPAELSISGGLQSGS